MTQFAFRAVPLSGSSGEVRGRQEASDERALREMLRGRGLVALEVRPVRLMDAARSYFSRERLRRRDTLWFFQTLRTLLGSSVPIEGALSTMMDLAPGARLRGVCGRVRERLRSGVSLADAVEGQAGLASASHVALLRTGHESGRLAHVVGLIDASLTGEERIRRTVTARLMYPAILFVASLGALWFLSTFVIPRFAGTLEELGGSLPLSTRLTLGAAKVMVWAGPPMLAALVAAYAFRGVLVTGPLRARMSRLALRTPVIGSLVWHGQGAMITDILATMLEGGGDVLKGLEQAQRVVHSAAIGERLERARRKVREGGDLGEAFSSERVLPPLVTAVLQVGMKGGDLVGGLKQSSRSCVERQEALVERLMVLMEPAVIVFMAGAVGWVVYALVMGMLALNEAGALS